MAGTVTTIKKQGHSIKKYSVFSLLIVAVVFASVIVFRHIQHTNLTKRDTERKVAIDKINDQLELYYVGNGRYPSLKNLNDSRWLNANMPGLKTTDLKDPSDNDKNSKVVSKPKLKAYSYSPQALKTSSACDNIATYCLYYKLTATLEGGGTYDKTSQ